MKCNRVYFFCSILWTEILATRSTISLEKPAATNYFDGLVNYLKNESKLYQVVFILDDQFHNTDPMMNSLTKEVDQHFPSFSVSYNQTLVWLERIWFKGERQFRRTTLFVFGAKDRNSTKLIHKKLDEINSMTRLALPRCLIMKSFKSSRKYLKKTLLNFWEKNYLDATIMTYDQAGQVTPFLSQINPFMNEITNKEISFDIQWFPNKIQNLNGYEMELNLYYGNFGWTETTEKRKKVTKIFEKAMNFKLKKECLDKSKPVPTLQFITHKYITELKNVTTTTENLRFLKIDSIKAIIPKSETYKKNLVFSSELFFMLFGTIVTIVIIRFIAFVMKFKRATWQTLNISQMIIGMSANHEPINLKERIVFGSLLITCIVYTGYFYSVILDIGLQTEPEISTLEELADSSLTPIASSDLRANLKSSSIPLIKKLGRKTKATSLYMLGLSKYYCLEYLVKHKNVSCMFPDAEYVVNSFSALTKEELNVKILPEAVDFTALKWVTTGNSPYTDRYNEIILRASEFGLFKEYYVSNVVHHKTLPPEEIGKQKIFFVTSYVLGIGYFISLIVFLLELFCKYKYFIMNPVIPKCNLFSSGTD